MANGSWPITEEAPPNTAKSLNLSMTYGEFRRIKAQLGLDSEDLESGFSGIRIDGTRALKLFVFFRLQTQIASKSTGCSLASSVPTLLPDLFAVHTGTRGSFSTTGTVRRSGVLPATSCISLVRIVSFNLSRSLIATTNEPGPPMTQPPWTNVAPSTRIPRRPTSGIRGG